MVNTFILSFEIFYRMSSSVQVCVSLSLPLSVFAFFLVVRSIVHSFGRIFHLQKKWNFSFIIMNFFYKSKITKINFIQNFGYLVCDFFSLPLTLCGQEGGR